MITLAGLRHPARWAYRTWRGQWHLASTAGVVAVDLGALTLGMRSRGIEGNIGLLALLALVPLVEWLGISRDAARRAEVATFALVVAAAGIHGGFGALAVGLTGILLGDRLRGGAHGSAVGIRALVFTSLVAAGVAIQSHPAFAPLAFALWYAYGATFLWNRLLNRDRHGIAAALAIGAWFTLLVTLPAWLPALPAPVRAAILPALPALHFALGFTTLDTLLVSAIGLFQSGWRGIRFWQRELFPVFTRYTVMAVGGAVIAAAFVAQPVTGLAFGGAALVLVVVIRREIERSRQRLIATMCALSSALDARDPHTKGHSDRVASYCVALADRLGWPTAQRREIEIAAHLHDVGKIGVPDAVLLKPDRLAPEEVEIVQRHAQLSADIVRNVGEFQGIAGIIRQHHERLDGSGYPLGLCADQQVPPARLLAVADVFDALTSTRPYRTALPREEALEIIERDRGFLYDAVIVDALAELVHGNAIEGAIQYGYCLTH